MTTPPAGPKIIFSLDTSTSDTETNANHFNPLASVHRPAEQTTTASFTNQSALFNPPSNNTNHSIDVIGETLDKLHQAEQALAAEMHRINHQETSALDEIKTLVDKAKSIEQREDQLNQFIKRIAESRNQITRDPSSAAAIAQEGWLKALTEDNQPAPKSAVTPIQPPVAPLRPIPPLPQIPSVPKLTLESKPTSLPTAVIPQPTLPTSSPAEQKIVTAIKAIEPPPRQVFLDNTTRVYRAPDGNGVIIAHGKDTMHISDAELIQAGLGVDDLAEIQDAPVA